MLCILLYPNRQAKSFGQPAGPEALLLGKKEVVMARAMLLCFFICLAHPVWAQANELVVPAGTMLQCTLSEPNLSSTTVQVGDPILCYLSSLRVFRYSAFPRGAYLSGHFEEYRDPGRFFGKGWLRLEFNRLILPDTVVPVSTKIVSAGRLPVDKEGRLRGRGHARRDVLGWALPILWPIKVFTLPMRGPRPTLQGEVRVTLRLMDDLPLPPASGTREAPTLSKAEPPPSMVPLRVGSRFGGPPSERLWYAGASWPAAEPGLASLKPAVPPGIGEPVSSEMLEPSQRAQPHRDRFTVLLLKDRPGYVATDYWIETDQLHCMIPGGERKVLPLELLDLAATVQLNRERGVEVVLRPKSNEP